MGIGKKHIAMHAVIGCILAVAASLAGWQMWSAGNRIRALEAGNAGLQKRIRENSEALARTRAMLMEMELIAKAGTAPALPPAPDPTADSALVAMAGAADWIGITRNRQDWTNGDKIVLIKGDAGICPSGKVPDLAWNEHEAWIVFGTVDLKSNIDRLSHLAGPQWYMPYTVENEQAVRKAVPMPAEWGPAVDGLRMGLRARAAACPIGGPVPVEIAIQNTGSRPLMVLQHRYNIYDYYEHTEFAVRKSSGETIVIKKPQIAMEEFDRPLAITLEPGMTYIHTAHLDQWSNPFDTFGVYAVTCMYSLPQMSMKESLPWWKGNLVAPPIRIVVEPAKE